MNQLEISKFPTLEYAANEAFNTLSTSLFYCGTDIKTILITSRYAVEGKSFVSMNLMRTLASLNKRVVLLDTDLRRSGIVGRFRIRFDTSAPMGLAQYLAGMCQMKDILYGTNIPNAYMIPIGREVSSSLQLLSSERMPELMEQLRSTFDVVLVDSPPAAVIEDAVEIGDVKAAIEKTGCKVLGAVLNNVDFDAYSNRKYYYKSERYTYYYKNQYSVRSSKKTTQKK